MRLPCRIRETVVRWACSTFDAAKCPPYNITNTRNIYHLPAKLGNCSGFWEKATMRKCIAVSHRCGRFGANPGDFASNLRTGMNPGYPYEGRTGTSCQTHWNADSMLYTIEQVCHGRHGRVSCRLVGMIVTGPMASPRSEQKPYPSGDLANVPHSATVARAKCGDEGSKAERRFRGRV